MPSIPAAELQTVVPARPPARWHRSAVVLLSVLAATGFLLLFHNYAFNLLPARTHPVAPAAMRPDPEPGSFAYYFDFSPGRPDRWQNAWSRSRFSEDGREHSRKQILPAEIKLVGGDRWSHEPGRVLFATVDNSDPRVNGRSYALHYPRLYSGAIGRGALAGTLLALGGLLLLLRRPPAPAMPAPPAPSRGRSWPLHCTLALLVFCGGLYCNTGTRSPYGVTFISHVDPATGYLYSIDHGEFRKVFAFLDGAPREVWADCLVLRRILFPAMAWPFMKLLGFEAGGLIVSCLLSVGSFLYAARWMRNRIGESGGKCGLWLLALYPGYAYWFSQPYPYACIAPGSLLLLIGLVELDRHRDFRSCLLLSLAMGLANLAYDFAPIFLPATAFMLLARRRGRDLLWCPLVQLLPLLLWLWALRESFGVPLNNSNTAAYGTILRAYLQIDDYVAWLMANRAILDVAGYVYFGSNFLFLPGLFLIVLALDRFMGRVALPLPAAALLGTVALLFCFNNLAPDYTGAWPMRGSWIARLYQPAFPVMIYATARWWQQASSGRPIHRILLALPLVAVGAANALVIFGPILRNPGRVSEAAFFQFYSHSDYGAVLQYEPNLQRHETRLPGFNPRPIDPPPH